MDTAIKIWSSVDGQPGANNDPVTPLENLALESQVRTERLEQALARNAALEIFTLPSTVKGYTLDIWMTL